MPVPFHGPRISDAGTLFRVWAPRLEHLTLRFYPEGVPPVDLPMARDPDGVFSADVPGAGHGTRYALVHRAEGRHPGGTHAAERVRPDPASLRQPGGVHGPSQLHDVRSHRWSDPGWRGVPLRELVFYELHVGTFTAEGTLDAAAARIEDLRDLGVTCVELMPVQPFPGPRNWGYDGVLWHAVHEAYGGPAALQRLVDRAHQAGLAVCLDVVFNHLGPEGNYLPELGPYLTSRHASPWGDAVSYDQPASTAVRRYALEAAMQWVRDFQVDALRLDAVHAIRDDSPRHIVAEIAAAVRDLAASTGRRIHVIAESDLNDRRVVEPPPAGWGASAMWADDLHHALHALCTGERDHYYRDFGDPADVVRALAEGFVYQGQPSRFRGRPHGTSARGLGPRRFVACSQDHDQVGNRPHGERTGTLLPPEALSTLAALVILGPALPLLFMGEEYGETRPFLYFTSHTDPALGKAVSEGRRREHISAPGGPVPDPQEPATFEQCKLTHRRDGRHGELRETYRRLIALRRRHIATIARDWPRVSAEGRVISMERPGLAVNANLGPEPAGALPAWGHLDRGELSI